MDGGSHPFFFNYRVFLLPYLIVWNCVMTQPWMNQNWVISRLDNNLRGLEHLHPHPQSPIRILKELRTWLQFSSNSFFLKLRTRPSSRKLELVPVWNLLTRTGADGSNPPNPGTCPTLALTSCITCGCFHDWLCTLMNNSTYRMFCGVVLSLAVHLKQHS